MNTHTMQDRINDVYMPTWMVEDRETSTIKAGFTWVNGDDGRAGWVYVGVDAAAACVRAEGEA